MSESLTALYRRLYICLLLPATCITCFQLFILMQRHPPKCRKVSVWCSKYQEARNPKLPTCIICIPVHLFRYNLIEEHSQQATIYIWQISHCRSVYLDVETDVNEQNVYDQNITHNISKSSNLVIKMKMADTAQRGPAASMNRSRIKTWDVQDCWR